MKKSIHITLSIFLSAIILLSGSGLVIGKMVCLKSKHELFYATQAKDCCGDTPSETSVKAKCCELQNIAFHPTNFVPSNHFTLKSIPAVTISAFHISAISLLKFSHAENFVYQDPPLERTYSSPLPLLGIFRI